MKKKELFAYMEALDFLLVETNNRLRKLEDELINARCDVVTLQVKVENLEKPILISSSIGPLDVRTWSEHRPAVENFESERMKQVITADSVESFWIRGNEK